MTISAFLTAALSIVTVAQASSLLPSRSECQLSGNPNGSNYTVLANDTIFTIAKSVNRGACDIARFNRMADAELLTTGTRIRIPKEVCHPDNSTCLLNDEGATATCVLGGPHVYTTFLGDTLEKIALKKLKITLDSLLATGAQAGYGSTDVLPAGQMIKVPQCSPSQCSFQPFQLQYGVYKDLAEKHGSTVGQIFALNGFNFSDAATGDGPVITLPMNCTALSSNITVIS